MSELDPASRFFSIKIGALLHDPPAKMFNLREHEKIAKGLRGIILSNIKLLNPDLPDLVDPIKKADIAASTFDRWFLEPLGKASYVVDYRFIHNIYDTRYRKPIPVKENIERVIFEKQTEIAKKLNKVLTKLESCQCIRDKWYKVWLMYTTLYVLLESMWYKNSFEHRLPISLADTRAPTHTIFDHLYASATVANLFYKYAVERKLIPSGYLIRIDIPGVQRFISSARKTGDLWAASWILSNLTWKVIWKIISYYGPDSLITPSPRLNSYLINYLLRELHKLTGSCIDCVDDLEYIKNTIASSYIEAVHGITPFIELLGAYKSESVERVYEYVIRRLSLIPLIPVTAVLVIPKIGYKLENLEFKLSNVDEVMEFIEKLYVVSWKELLSEIGSELDKAINRARREGKEIDYLVNSIGKRLLDLIQELISVPHTGLRIDIVDVESLYNKLRECLDKGSKCEEIGIGPKKVKQLIEDYKLDKQDLAIRLLWHIGFIRALNNPDRHSIPVPRAFWYLVNNSLKEQDRYYGGRNWIPCSLCGSEPAVIKLGKIEIDGVIDYDPNDLKEFIKKINICNEESIEECMEKVKPILMLYFKPGEALGPYCLFKRIVYITYRSEIKALTHLTLKKGVVKSIKKISTDDISLTPLDLAIRKSINVKDFLKDFIENLKEQLRINISEDDARRILKWIFIETLETEIKEEIPPNRDLSRALEELNSVVRGKAKRTITYDRFIEILSGFLHKELERIKNSGKLQEFINELFMANVTKTTTLIDEIFRYTDRLGEIIRSLSNARTHYAIVRGDADYMGDIITGKLQTIAINKYFEELYNSITREGSITGSREQACSSLGRAYNIAMELAKVINGGDERKLIVSPAHTSHLSFTLMITAIRDLLDAINLMGFVVFSGGDDILALFPIETVYPAIIRMRSNFYGERLFNTINPGKTSIPVSSTPVTGRSFSVRIASLKDLLSHEIMKATQYLEEYAKNTIWCINKGTWTKDTLVISDSRSETQSLLPLRKYGSEILVNEDLVNLIMRLWLYMLSGILSKSIPEDLYKYLYGVKKTHQLVIRDPGNLERFSKKIIERNIEIRGEDRVKHILEKILDDFKKNKLYTISSNEEYGVKETPLLIHVFNFIKIMRGYP